MKKIFKRFSKFVTTVLVALFIINGCNESDIYFEQPATKQAYNFKTVDLQDAINYFNSENYLSKLNSYIDLKPDLESIHYEEMLGSDAELVVISAKTNFNNINTRVIQIAIDGKIQTLLFHQIVSDPNKNFKSSYQKITDSYYDRIAITDIEGNVIEAYQLEEGKPVSQLIVSDNITANDCDENYNPYSIFCHQILDEVVVTAPSIVTVNNYNYTPFNSGNFTPIWRYNNNYGYTLGAGYYNYYLQNEIQKLCDECNCNSGTSIDFLIEEPKWGQLADKDEVINEIEKALENAGNKAAKEKSHILKEHFGSNLMFNPATDYPYDTGNDVNRYIYSKKLGWIDFHHVFYMLEKSYATGPAIALIAGETAEVIQALNPDNNSGFSYEDLVSNKLGVYMYIMYGKDIADGNMSFENMVSTVLDEIEVKAPEEAPNFEYIPAYLDSNYPKNYDYAPLNEEQLEAAARKAFCSKSFEQQLRNLKARNNYSR